MKRVLMIIICLALAACSSPIKMTGIEHSIYGNLTRSHSGGEVYSMDPSGHQEQGGSWSAGTKIKTIWVVK